MAVAGLAGEAVERHPYAALQICCLVAAVTLATESLMWLLAYRKPSWQSTKVSVDRQSQKLEALKAAPAAPGQASKQKAKRVEQMEKALREQVVKEMSSWKVRQTVVVTATLFGTYRLLGWLYGGQVVAQLPFEPFSLLQKLTHRGLPAGAAATDCATTFIYTLCQLAVRHNISKLLNWGPSRRMLEFQQAQWQPKLEEKLR